MQVTELETPCLVLDRAKLARNIDRMRKQLSGLGVSLRAHGKTAKSIQVARMALEGQPGGLTVSTLKEAEYFLESGITDLLYAVGIAPVKLDHVISLTRSGAKITLILDSVEQAKFVAAKAREAKVVLPAMIEIDSDGHRSGVRPDDPLLIEIGRLLHQGPGTELKGVLTHAGSSYGCKSLDEIRAVSAQERDAAVQCAEALRRAGLPCPIVSVGSTPTATYASDYTGVTEVRSGVYMFFDLVMAGLGVCKVDDIALSVLTSVIGHQPRKGWVITDSGWMSLSHDRRTAKQKVDQGFGVVCDMEGRPFGDVIVADAYQEHGVIARRAGLAGGLELEKFPIGSMLRVLPNHACATATMHDRYYVVDGGTEIVDVWERIRGW